MWSDGIRALDSALAGGQGEAGNPGGVLTLC